MKYIKIFCIAFFSLAIHLPKATAQKEMPPKPQAPKDFSLPGKKQIALDNGMRATLVQYGQLPKVTVVLAIKTGSMNERADQVWLSDLLAEMMQQGTQSLNAQQIQRSIAKMGGTLNINSGSYQFLISGTALSENATKLIALMADLAMHPALPENQLSRIKTDLKRELSIRKANPQMVAYEKFSKIVHGNNSPYGRLFSTDEILDSYTINDVKNFYEENVGAQRAVLYVAGAFNESEVNKAIVNSFNSWKPGVKAVYPKDNFQYTPQTTIINRKGAQQTTLYLGIPVPEINSPDYMQLTIANLILGGAFGSRITRNIREDKGYTYSPYSTINNVPGESVWFEQADITSEHTLDAIKEIKKEILKLSETPPSKEELAGIQRSEAGRFVLRNSSPQSIINQLNFMDHFGLEDSYLTDRVKHIYAVTPEEVTFVIKKYLTPDKLSLVMVGDEEQIKAQEKK